MQAAVLITGLAGRQYWENTSADVNGMLGGIPSVKGFGSVSRIDLQGSRAFLAKLGIVRNKSGRKSLASALEGGAGIGRITQGLLLDLAEHVDVVEPVSKFTDVLSCKSGVRTIFNVGLEEWEPVPGTEYDLIWTQWCLGHLTDSQIVRYLELCKTALTPGHGIIVFKENLSGSDVDVFDETDSSVTRQDETFRSLFAKAGVKVVRTELQRGFPDLETLTKRDGNDGGREGYIQLSGSMRHGNRINDSKISIHGFNQGLLPSRNCSSICHRLSRVLNLQFSLRKCQKAAVTPHDRRAPHGQPALLCLVSFGDVVGMALNIEENRDRQQIFTSPWRGTLVSPKRMPGMRGTDSAEELCCLDT
ncbi:hypothetical protein XA68_16694 [Ophiocordyceps unilateralis]|uniref:Alpha N-terminal protein methyltransferase 1 n=1 Tax=Ophiocordyceps unilateralis TaxID=268505 RepID=A0A2A9P659_OPHUN|nr:hypothetical protein XA68_16694 [Ophiocordyceps unilateralis]